jgi:hypothetical protein
MPGFRARLRRPAMQKAMFGLGVLVGVFALSIASRSDQQV